MRMYDQIRSQPILDGHLNIGDPVSHLQHPWTRQQWKESEESENSKSSMNSSKKALQNYKKAVYKKNVFQKEKE